MLAYICTCFAFFQTLFINTGYQNKPVKQRGKELLMGIKKNFGLGTSDELTHNIRWLGKTINPLS